MMPAPAPPTAAAPSPPSGGQVRVFAALLAAQWQTVLAYRGATLLWALQTLLMPLMLMLAWLSIERRPGAPFAAGDYFLYYLLLPLVTNLTMCWTVYSLPAQIRDGTLSRDLLKPVHPLFTHVFEHLATKVLQIVYVLPAPVLIGIWFHDLLPPLDLSWPRVLLTFIALALAASLRFLMGTTLAVTGFWIEHVENLNLVVNQGAWALFGGMIVPLETFPPPLRQVANLLPYRYSLSFPLELIGGRLSGAEIWTGFLCSLGWTFFFFLLLRRLWRHGLRSYTAYGG